MHPTDFYSPELSPTRTRIVVCSRCAQRGLRRRAHTLTPRAWRHRGTSHRSSNIAARRTVKRAPGGLDLPMRETGETRVSRHAYRFGQPPRMRWSFVRRPSEGVIDRSSDPPSPPPIRDSRFDASLRFFDRGLDRFHHPHRDARTVSAIRKAFHQRAPRPSFSRETLDVAVTGLHRGAPCGAGTSGSLSARARSRDEDCAGTEASSSFSRSRSSEAFAKTESRKLGPSFTRIRTPRFSDAVSMARFSSLLAAGPDGDSLTSATQSTYGHDLEPLLLVHRHCWLPPGPRPRPPRFIRRSPRDDRPDVARGEHRASSRRE